MRRSSLRQSARVLARASALLALAALSPEPCRAYSAADDFAKAAGQGGGGGRFFTASYFDGYGCNVCHGGGTAPKVQVNGLPASYQPGVTYDIEVTWDTPVALTALNLELVDRNGRVPGQVVLPDPMTVDARGRCGAAATGKVPAFQRDVGARKVLGVEVCKGLQSLRFRFTPSDVPELAFSLSSVRSNSKSDVLGDGVTTIRKVLRRVGEPARTGDCALLPGATASRWPSFVLALFALGVFRRARFARRRPA